MIYKLSKNDIEVLKQVAGFGRSYGRGTKINRLEAGIRYNMEDDTKPESVNIMIVSDTGDWDDTDLADHASLAELQKNGFELDKNGHAELDFYVYASDGELVTNMSASFDAGGIIEANCGGRSWERPLSDV